jgi:RIO kinase 2
VGLRTAIKRPWKMYALGLMISRVVCSWLFFQYIESVKDDPSSEEGEEEEEEEEEKSDEETESYSPANAEASTKPCAVDDESQQPESYAIDRRGDSPAGSPPNSRPASPESTDSQVSTRSASEGIREKVASDVTKNKARQHRKYHSKKGAQRTGGRNKGSKAKMDTRVKIDDGGFWD